MWVLFAAISSVLLGIYDIIKKHSVNQNAVVPVLLISTLTGACIFLPSLIYSSFSCANSQSFFYIPAIGLHEHLLFFLKSLIVGLSWFFIYYAFKNLPITIASPIRASAPLWTLIGAITILGERMNLLQWLGMILIFICYYLFSLAGKKEGIIFKTNRWVLFVFIGTLLGSCAALFDKYLVSHYSRIAMQAWFSVYLAIIYLVVFLVLWLPMRKKLTPFVWKWTIPLIGITLTITDFVYFYALSLPGALIALVSIIRRSNVVVSFSFGALIFKEKNLKSKAFVLIAIILGVVLIAIGNTIK